MISRIRHLSAMALLAVLLVLPGCTGIESPTEPTLPSAPAVLPQDQLLLDDLLGVVNRTLTGLVSCPVLPYSEASAVIGPNGGQIVSGPHRLVIPPGALDRNVRITMQVPTDRVASVELLPHGLQFRRPVALTLSYKHCGLVASLAPKRIAYTTKRLEIIEFLLSLDNLLKREVTGALPHFSRYAVAW
jgi:hypothetical protein